MTIQVEQEMYGWTLEPLRNQTRDMEEFAQKINDFLVAMGIDAPT